MRSRRVRWLAMLMAMLSTTPVVANEVSELLKEAEAAVSAGHLRLANTRLHQATTLLKEMEMARVQTVFPAPPKGWSNDVDNDALEDFRSMGIGSIFVSAQGYRRGESTVRLVLMQKPSAAHPLFDMLLGTLESQVSIGTAVDVGRYAGRVLCPQSNAGECDLVARIGPDYVLYANSHGIEQAELVSFSRAMKLDLVEKFR